MKAHSTPLTTSRVSAAGLHCAAFICESAAKATNIIHLNASRYRLFGFAPDCLHAPRPSFACARLPPAFSRSSPHMKPHLVASQKHNNQLGATSSLTPPRVACDPQGGAVLPTPRRVCGGDSHLSGASKLTSLPSCLPGASFRRIFPLSAACFC